MKVNYGSSTQKKIKYFYNNSDVPVLPGVYATLDQEAIHVNQSSPKWTAPKQNGRPAK